MRMAFEMCIPLPSILLLSFYNILRSPLSLFAGSYRWAFTFSLISRCDDERRFGGVMADGC